MQECTQSICFNKFDLLNVVNNNDINDDFEINDIDLCNKYMMNNNINDLNDLNDVINEDIRGKTPPKYDKANNMIDNNFNYDLNGKIWSRKVPESTYLCYNTNKKYIYPGYLCNFINPINQDDLYQQRKYLSNTQVNNPKKQI